MSEDGRRVTVKLIPNTAAALDELCVLTADREANIINRAIVVYEFVARELAMGNEILTRDRETGDLEKVYLRIGKS